MKKKTVLWASVIGGAALLAALGFVASRHIRERNVFDQMYYTRVHEDEISFWSRDPDPYRGKFKNMKQLKAIDWELENGSVWMGLFFEDYEEKYLEPGASLHIYFFTDSRTISITYSVPSDPEDPEEGNSVYKYIYSVDDKTLTYREKNVADPQDGNRNFLYDIFLKDWFEANPDLRFSLQDPGQFEFREVSWETEL